MDRKSIQHHDLPFAQAGCKELLHVDRERDTISRSIQYQRWPHARKRERSDQGHDGTIIAGYLADCALPLRGIGVQRGHGNVGTGLVYEDQILAQHVCGAFSPGSTLGFFLLACSDGLFFRVQPKAILARLILAGLTLMPYDASHIWQCCSRVASGWAFNCSTRPACKAAPLMLGRPGIALGKTWPLSRRCLR